MLEGPIPAYFSDRLKCEHPLLGAFSVVCSMFCFRACSALLCARFLLVPQTCGSEYVRAMGSEDVLASEFGACVDPAGAVNRLATMRPLPYEPVLHANGNLRVGTVRPTLAPHEVLASAEGGIPTRPAATAQWSVSPSLVWSREAPSSELAVAADPMEVSHPRVHPQHAPDAPEVSARAAVADGSVTALASKADDTENIASKLGKTLAPSVLVASNVALGLLTAATSRHRPKPTSRHLYLVAVLWLLGGLGGAHLFYCGRRRSGWICLLTLGGCGVRWLLDVRKLRSLASAFSPAVSSSFLDVSPSLQRQKAARGAGPAMPPMCPPPSALVHENFGAQWAASVQIDAEAAGVPLSPPIRARGVDFIHTSSFYGSRAPLM